MIKKTKKVTQRGFEEDVKLINFFTFFDPEKSVQVPDQWNTVKDKISPCALRTLQGEINSVFSRKIDETKTFEGETLKNLIRFRFRFFGGSIRYLLESQMAGSIAFAVDSVKYAIQGVSVSERLTKTRLSNSLDVVYSTIFMEQLT